MSWIKQGPFWVMVVGLLLLIIAANSGLKLPEKIETAFIVFVTTWIAGQSAVDVIRAKNAGAGR